jgi:hypothetical protein
MSSVTEWAKCRGEGIFSRAHYELFPVLRKKIPTRPFFALSADQSLLTVVARTSVRDWLCSELKFALQTVTHGSSRIRPASELKFALQTARPFLPAVFVPGSFETRLQRLRVRALQRAEARSTNRDARQFENSAWQPAQACSASPGL